MFRPRSIGLSWSAHSRSRSLYWILRRLLSILRLRSALFSALLLFTRNSFAGLKAWRFVPSTSALKTRGFRGFFAAPPRCRARVTLVQGLVPMRNDMHVEKAEADVRAIYVAALRFQG